jgi:hypothetical protein
MAAADGLVEDVGRRGNYGIILIATQAGGNRLCPSRRLRPQRSAGTMVRRGEVSAMSA